MQAEEAVEIDGGVLAWATDAYLWGGYRDGGAQIVIMFITEGHHNVQAVHGAALENRHQHFLARAGHFCRARAGEPGRSRTQPEHGDAHIFEEDSPRLC